MIKKIILCFLTINTLISCNIESESSTNEINLNDYENPVCNNKSMWKALQ